MIKLSSKPFVSFWIILACLPAAGLAQEKSYYGKIDPKIRLQILAQARTMRIFDPAAEIKKEDDKNNVSNKLDVVKYFSEKCDFPYSRDQNGLPVRPQVSCVYTPKTEEDFNGMTAKFDCTFTFVNKDGQTKEKTLKVKYEPKKYAGGGHKEIPQAVIGTSLARLLGFNSTTYCPVDLTCKDCPSDNPWAQDKSSAPAMLGNIVEFKNVVVESKIKGYKVEDSKNQNNTKRPQGISFRDLNRYFLRSPDKNLLATMKAEREALTIWINFVVSGDADYHNNKLFCTNSTKPATPQEIPKCLESIAVVNDYGNSMGYSNSDTRLQVSQFAKDALRGRGSDRTTTGASGNAGASNHPISDAGRLLFIQQANAITDAQLTDIFNLAQVDKVSDGNVNAWIQAFRKKVERMK